MRAVLERDFLSEASRGRAVVLRTVVGGGVAAVVCLLLVDASTDDLANNPDRVAAALFGAGAVALLALLALLTPAAVVGSVLGERLGATLPLVLASPVGPTGFAAAKLASRTGAVLTMALGALFPLAMVTLIGGVSGSQILDLGLAAVAVTVELGAFALWISTATRRLATGVLLAYLLPILRWTVTMLLTMTVLVPGGPFGDYDPPGKNATWWLLLAETTPAMAGAKSVGPADFNRGVARIYRRGFQSGTGTTRIGVPTFPVVTPNVAPKRPVPAVRAPVTPPVPTPPPLVLRPAVVYLGFSLVLAGLAVLAAGRRLATEAEPRQGRFEGWLRRRGGRRSPGAGNPVAWKESRLLDTPASRPLYYTVLSLMVAAELAYVLACLFAVRVSRDFTELGIGIVAGHALFLAVVAGVGASLSLAQERATGSLDLLRASPLTAREIVGGKLLGALAGLGFLALLPVAHVGIMAASGILRPGAAFTALGLLGGTVALWLAIGMRCGLGARTPAAAVGRISAWLGGLVLGLPVIAAAAATALGRNDGDEVGAAIVAGSPPVGTFLLVELAQSRDAWHSHGPSASAGYGGSVAWILMYVGVTLFLATTLPRVLARRFEAEAA